MNLRVLKILTILSLVGLAIAIGGCKVAVIVPAGGDVKSLSGTRDCSGGSLCEHNTADLTFKETFTAIARPGYKFNRWNGGLWFICGDVVGPVCEMNFSENKRNALVDAILASGTYAYLMPLFDFVGIDTDGDSVADHVDEDDDNDGIFDGDDACPLDSNPNCDIDSITVNGRTWAQPSQFVTTEGPSWNDVNAVCPGGVCKGTLNGHDVTGWTWATATDVAELFFYYHEDKEALASGYGMHMRNSPWAPKFFDAGWIPMRVCYSVDCSGNNPRLYHRIVDGYLYQPALDGHTSLRGGVAGMIDFTDPDAYEDDTVYYYIRDPMQEDDVSPFGVWLCRD